MSEIRQVTITIRSPTDYDHEGMAEIGHYTVCDGFVQLVNETGTKPLGKLVKIGTDSPERVAGRLTRVLWSKRLQDRNGFNRKLGRARDRSTDAADRVSRVEAGLARHLRGRYAHIVGKPTVVR